MAERNFENRTLYHGDNLEFLRGMNSETVRLIATDPPFNKNRDFHATPDSLAAGARFKDRWRWDDDVHEEWTDSNRDDWPAVDAVIGAALLAYGDDMGAFLCWLGVRLMEMHRVLRRENKQAGWMMSEDLARITREHARDWAERVAEEWDSEEIQGLVGGRE